jgi:hypothetical protein
VAFALVNLVGKMLLTQMCQNEMMVTIRFLNAVNSLKESLILNDDVLQAIAVATAFGLVTGQAPSQRVRVMETTRLVDPFRRFTERSHVAMVGATDTAVTVNGRQLAEAIHALNQVINEFVQVKSNTADNEKPERWSTRGELFLNILCIELNEKKNILIKFI